MPKPCKPTGRRAMFVRTIAETMERLRKAAKAEGMHVSDLIHEAIYIHLHHMESRAKPKLRKKAICPSCGTVDITNVETRLAERKKK